MRKTIGLKSLRVLVIGFALVFSTSSAFSEVNSKADAQVALARQNNTGHPANNFSYTMLDGRKKKLYALDAKYTLLFFYNPECDACKVYKDMLAASNIINERIKTGIVKVLAVYIDKDVGVWKKHLPEMPKIWIQGRDENEYLYKNNVYDLHVIGQEQKSDTKRCAGCQAN